MIHEVICDGKSIKPMSNISGVRYDNIEIISSEVLSERENKWVHSLLVHSLVPNGKLVRTIK